MSDAVAYSTLAFTVTLAVWRPRIRWLNLRLSPGSAALLGVIVLLATRLIRVEDMAASARLQWRPLLSLAGIMVMTGVVHEVGAFDRLAGVIESRARGVTALRTFGLLFALAVITPSLLNNDSAILLLTPLAIALGRRLYPTRPEVTAALAFVVFLAPGVAPLVVSNPMNMIVAEYAGIGFHYYALIMAPIALAGALVTYGILRLCFGGLFASATAAPARVEIAPPHRGERAALVLLALTFVAYPIVTALGGQIWMVSTASAMAALGLTRALRVAPVRKVLGHVSLDILVFLWGVYLVVAGLRTVGVVDRLAHWYALTPDGSAAQLGLIGVSSALGSAVANNHPMSILNMSALDPHNARGLLAALIGGDIGPRLLPTGSLAGLLWIHLARRGGVQVSVARFIALGALVALPTLALSLLLLWRL